MHEHMTHLHSVYEPLTEVLCYSISNTLRIHNKIMLDFYPHVQVRYNSAFPILALHYLVYYVEVLSYLHYLVYYVEVLFFVKPKP